MAWILAVVQYINVYDTDYSVSGKNKALTTTHHAHAAYHAIA